MFRTKAALLSLYVLVLKLGTRPQCTTTFVRDVRTLLSESDLPPELLFKFVNFMFGLQLKDEQRGLIPHGGGINPIKMMLPPKLP